MLVDGIYQGTVWHQRHLPKPHGFRYPMAMLMLDTEAVDSTFQRSRWWSVGRFNLISFKREDYIGDSSQSIKQAIAQRIWLEFGEPFDGTVKMLSHPRYFGFVFNPVSFYFAYQSGELRYIVAEINNTPWNERYSYALRVDSAAAEQTFDFAKQFHVSPFMPMAMHYQWRFRIAADQITIHMSLRQDGIEQFAAAMSGSAQSFSRSRMRWLPWKYPLQTVLVVSRIYWHALRLKLKGIPFYSHPGKSLPGSETRGPR